MPKRPRRGNLAVLALDFLYDKGIATTLDAPGAANGATLTAVNARGQGLGL